MQNIIRIIKISKPLHSLVAVLSGLIVLTALLDLVAPLLSKSIVDQIVLNLQHKGGSIQTLTFFIALAFASSLASILFTTITERLGDHFAGRIRKYLTEIFFDKALRLPQSYYDSEISGKIVNQLNRGIQSIQDFMNTATNFILPAFLQSIFTIIVLAYYNLPIAFFTLLLFPIYLTISYYSSKKWGEEEVKKNVYEDRTRGRIQEVVSNMSLVKSFAMQKQEFATISRNLSAINAIYARQSQTFHIFDFLRNFSLLLILTIINIIVFYSTFQGKLTLGELVLILQLLLQARRPLFAMSFILTRIQTAESGSKEYFAILNIPAIEDYTAPLPEKRVKEPTIRFDHVTFQYETANPVLKDVSFTLNKQEQVALVGHSGAGKSTIVSLILKFYDPTNGTIYLNDSAYDSLTHNEIRSNIALVFQENELFSSTIRDNVAYGTHGATDADVIAALKLANAYEFVKKLPKGLLSEVGERGVRLSGGQKQRIQIARAILKNAPILILDEATSNLDAKSEKEVQEGLHNLMKNKLVIIIAHRFSTIQNVQKVLVIDNGHIVDSGTPQALAQKPGIYADLLHYQIEGNKKLLEKFELY